MKEDIFLKRLKRLMTTQQALQRKSKRILQSGERCEYIQKVTGNNKEYQDS